MEDKFNKLFLFKVITLGLFMGNVLSIFHPNPPMLLRDAEGFILIAVVFAFIVGLMFLIPSYIVLIIVTDSLYKKERNPRKVKRIIACWITVLCYLQGSLYCFDWNPLIIVRSPVIIYYCCFILGVYSIQLGNSKDAFLEEEEEKELEGYEDILDA